ncbi:vacuolar ABC heavy metal transporter [Coccidioides immitis RS]|uniref:Vacuolar ABC heavy metal transporter n=1 Tax=Coccidioides immitis (strain RS) TaxID=246410 RepID=J3KBN0_COCIM|nr:vacuolar ABC heavy metal transporter [Coccidioides immitis RS]EAS32543.3 vacuolar ABC heavy metal transporter [Coccidioides immitis RS]TPX19597.1 hypothetical protein DIZ76_017389 [Coccidioides immitis]
MAGIPSGFELALVKVLYSVLPLVSACFFFIATGIRSIIAPKERLNPSRSKRRWRFTVGICVVTIFFSYVADAIISTFTFIPEIRPPTVPGRLFYSWASSLLWFINFLWFLDLAGPATYPFYGTWIAYLAGEGLLLQVSLKIHLPRIDTEVLLVACRFALLVTLVLAALRSHFVPTEEKQPDEEATPLLSAQEVTQQDSQSTRPSYGSCYSRADESAQLDVNISAKSKSQNGDSTEDSLTNEEDERTFWHIVEFLRSFLPFFWPSGKPAYQLLYLGIGGCLVVERIMNVIIPLQLGLITNLLTKSDGSIPWKEITVFIGLRLLHSSGGLSALRSFMWMPLEDLSYQKVSTTAFNHIMSLSCDFHDSKVSGAVWETIVRAQQVKDAVNHICFILIPTIVDLALAVSILYYLFDAYMALITATVTVMFLWTSGKIIDRQKNKQRDWIDKRMKEFSILCESTANWKTVAYFNRVPYEELRYRSSVKDHLKSRVGFRLWSGIENSIQSLVLLSGLMAACFIAAYGVATGSKPIGSFVMMLSYWAQLSNPLQSLANGFAGIVRDMVDAEELLVLLQQKPTVSDIPGAKPLVFDDGNIEFDGVRFSYDGKREVLKNVTFRAPAGKITAIVGKTGGGKSTILKLLCRFYDPVAGAINIDGQNTSKVALSSLREVLGVVPQDPVLFHDSIMANIRYASLGAADEEIVEACKAVALHEKIMSFPHGYDTVVGERGMKLSGGELQRVAIARAMIKNPKIVLLDEATSSVDSETEAHVQRSLKMLCAGRTTIVIAHRLSTIMNADQILVVNDGEIVERGTHPELLENRSYYHRLCSWQGFTTEGPKDKQSQVIINDINPLEATMENSALPMRLQDPAGNNSAQISNAERSGIAYYAAESEIPPQDLIDQDELCERCGNCLNIISSAMETSKRMAHPSRILKPEAPEFVPRAFQNYVSGPLHPYYIQVDANRSASNQRYTDHPPSGYASDTGESVEICTGYEESKPSEPKRKIDDGHMPTCPPLNDMPGNGVKLIAISSGERFPVGSEQHHSVIEEVLGAIGNHAKKNIIRRELSKSEPAGLMVGMSGDSGDVDRGLESSPVSRHGIPISQEPAAKTNEIPLRKHRRRRRRNNWRRRKEMRTTASTQSGTDGMRSSDQMDAKCGI